MGKSQTEKGKGFERFVAREFRGGGFLAERVFEFARGHGYDVVAKNGRVAFAIQCKAYRNYAPINKLREAEDGVNSGNDERLIPMLVTKGDRLRPTATVYLDDLLDILGEKNV